MKLGGPTLQRQEWGDSRASETQGAGEETSEATLSSAPRNSGCFGLRQRLGAAALAVVGFHRGLL